MQPVVPRNIFISAKLPTVEMRISYSLGCPLLNQLLYLQLLEMQISFTECCKEQTLSHLPNSDEIKELQTDYINMLTAIIDLLDGAKYLWEGEHHETK